MKYTRRRKLKKNNKKTKLKHHQPPPIFCSVFRERRYYIHETESDFYVKGKFKKLKGTLENKKCHS